MISYLFKKILGKKSEDEQKSDKFFGKISDNYQKISKQIPTLFQRALDEIKAIRQKCNNLLETNHKLGMRHLEMGNLSDAKIRFTIIIKFWPDFYEAYYQKAYILMLENQPFKAKQVIDKLMLRNPDILEPKILSLIEQVENTIKSLPDNE